MNRIILFSLSLFCVHAWAQEDEVSYKDGQYEFRAAYDYSTSIGNLTITRNKKMIAKESYEYLRVIEIKGADLDGDGRKEYLFDFFTGGAHCCFITKVGLVKGDRFSFGDSIQWNNGGYQLKDLDSDGEYELDGDNDMFAYAFTNYAQSYFSIAIYKYRNGKFYLANNEFEKEVKKHIAYLKDVLSEYTAKGFDCPRDEDEDTFNTDAGAVKAILAPITADYESIGQAAEGYKLIDKVYKCPDEGRFVKILKNEYKLK